MSLFCRHKWEEKERFITTRTYTYTGEVVNNCLLIIMKCKKCGELKKVHLP